MFKQRCSSGVINLLLFIPDYTDVDCIETVIPRTPLPNAAFHIESQRQLSRYFSEFEELQMLGRGAFGAVIKVVCRF